MKQAASYDGNNNNGVTNSSESPATNGTNAIDLSNKLGHVGAVTASYDGSNDGVVDEPLPLNATNSSEMPTTNATNEVDLTNELGHVATAVSSDDANDESVIFIDNPMPSSASNLPTDLNNSIETVTDSDTDSDNESEPIVRKQPIYMSAR